MQKNWKSKLRQLLFAIMFLLVLSGNVIPVQAQVTSVEDVEEAQPGKFENTEDGWIYIYEDGTQAADCLLDINEKTYYFSEEGIRQYGWQEIDSKWYYFGSKSKGYMYKNAWIKEKGKNTYYVGSDGSRCTGWYTGKNTYYFDKKGVYHKDKKIKERLINPKGKMVALTFDDGPGPYTDRLLKCLKNNRAAATFFLVGTSIANYPDTIQQMAKQGCEIGNHTWDHASLSSLNGSSIQSEIKSTNAQIRALTGHNATLVRPPYGAYNSNVQINAGAPLILWSIDTLDWKTRNAKNTINVVMNEVKDGSMILMHDIHSPSVDAAEVLIPKLIASGYQLVTVSELAKYRSVAMYSGGVYNAFYR